MAHPLVERILDGRAIRDREAFLSPSYDNRPDPFLMKDMDRAVVRILKAIENKEKIAVWHDYDCDGIPGGALLSDFFLAVGYPVRMHVPERADGYGLNVGGISALRAEGVSLIITVDCGITDVEEVICANELGVDVIVTDHHLPQETGLPPALAVVNAHRADDTYPSKELCGTGVAFKLVEGLIARGGFSLPVGWEKWLLDLVALATVADMVPLVGENRTLVRFGLTVMRKGRRPGIRALLEAERVPFTSVTEDDIAFSIAPKVNAASRMASPALAFELLTTSDVERARELARELVRLNGARKIEGMRVAKEVKRHIEMMPVLGDVIVAGSASWRPSLLGIAATSVVETYRKTVCLWGKDGGLIKGSCRSDGSVNIVTLMQNARDVFVDFGGHEFSGGFSVTEENIHRLPQVLEESMLIIKNGSTDSGLSRHSLREPEGHMSLVEMNEAAYEALRELAPFGMGNPKPLFRFGNVRVEKMFRFGAHKEHAKLVLSDDSGQERDAISFFISRAPFRDTFELLSRGDMVTVDGSLERSHFGGRKELRFRIVNLTAVEA